MARFRFDSVASLPLAPGMDVDASVEHAAALAGADAVKLLPADRTGAAVLDHNLLVEMRAGFDDVGAAELDLGLAAVDAHVHLGASPPAPDEVVVQPVVRPVGEAHVEAGVVAMLRGQSVPLMVEPGAGFDGDQGRLREEPFGRCAFDEREAGAWFDAQHQGRHAGLIVIDLDRHFGSARHPDQPAAAGARPGHVREGIALRLALARDGFRQPGDAVCLVDGVHRHAWLAAAPQNDARARRGCGDGVDERLGRRVLPQLPAERSRQRLAGIPRERFRIRGSRAQEASHP
jgi:hypothetical protein